VISINLYEILMQIVNFLILLYLLNKFLIKPLSEFVEKRSLGIKEDINSAKLSKEEAQQLAQDQKELLANARKESKEIRKQNEEIIQNERVKVLEKAKQDAESLVNSAKKEISLAVTKAKKDLVEEVGNISVSLAEEVLKRSINKKEKEALLNDGLKKLSVL